MEDRSYIIREKGVKYAVGALALLIVGVFVYSIIFIIIAKNTATLDVYYTPLSATVTIDGKVVTQRENSVSPGQHEVRAEKYGFEPKTMTVNVAGGETSPVYIILQPNTEFTADWYAKHPDDSTMAEGITGYESDYESEKYYEKYPALSKLPIKQKDYSIYRQVCDIHEACIAVYAESNYREEALDYFREKVDSDVGQYYFIFMSYHNPFMGEG